MLVQEVSPFHFSLEKLGQHLSANWGIWGKEKYTYSAKAIEDKAKKQKNRLASFFKKYPDRLRYGLNFSYGVCDLKGYAKPFDSQEMELLHSIYQEACQQAEFTQLPAYKLLITELACIRLAALRIPGFAKGNLVNESEDEEALRKYEYLDFFKFSLINYLIRIEGKDLVTFNGGEMASHLVLAWFLGTGSLVEKISVFFSPEVWQQIQKQCKTLVQQLEVSTELPEVNPPELLAAIDALAKLITLQKQYCPPGQIMQKARKKREESVHICNDYYQEYLTIQVPPSSSSNVLKAYIRLWNQADKRTSFSPEELLRLKRALRALRGELEQKYAEQINEEDFANISVEKFASQTNHPYFIALQYEVKLLARLYREEFPKAPQRDHVVALFEEIGPFYAVRKPNGKDLFRFSGREVQHDLPRLVVAHHIHNANCQTVRKKMSINRHIHWSAQQLVCNISSSSSREEVVKEERNMCIEMGFNHYRIHARRHLKAGNQNRAICNTINCTGIEYYLTLDDDYFTFPESALLMHQQIEEHQLDYFQSPQALEGIYKINCSNAERADAELMHYFENTSGRNQPRTYVFPRGTATMFCFDNGISSVTDTGGFLIDNASEDFGQGYLAYLQEENMLPVKKMRKRKPGQLSEQVLCIGEGVDLAGKGKQLIRWHQGGIHLYLHLFLPILFRGLLNGKTQVFTKMQTLRLLLFLPVTVANKFLILTLFCTPFLFYLFETMEVGGSQLSQLKGLNWMVISFSFLMILYNLLHFQLIMKRFSWSPFRIMFMENFTILASCWGYFAGMFYGKTKKWHANKSRVFRLNEYTGIAFLLALNGITCFLSWLHSGFGLVSFWSGFNVISFLTGLFVLRHRPGREQSFTKHFPNAMYHKLQKPVSALVLLLSTAYLILLLPKITGAISFIYFILIALYFTNLLASMGIGLYYNLHREPKKAVNS
ncbi:hypothetical protein AAG747_09325 [Rapidithrix thailandica]|uniref:Glycosyltransferase 2-like domain-containing protein n=1 Tax=Rapidithrix thailandica TaxID=413964 RepID=A0AAW9SB31_9BACT